MPTRLEQLLKAHPNKSIVFCDGHTTYWVCVREPGHRGRHVNAQGKSFGASNLPTAAEHAAADPRCAHGVSIHGICDECEF